MSTLRRLRRRLAAQAGYSLVELLTAMTILGAITGAVTVLFLQASQAEVDMNRRFQAQQQARIAVDKLRREVHCANAITPTGTSGSIDVTIPAQCPGGAGTARWCMQGGTGVLRREWNPSGGGCGATGTKMADNVQTTTPFIYTAPVTNTSLGKLRVTLPINTTPAVPNKEWKLVSDIVLRNTSR